MVHREKFDSASQAQAACEQRREEEVTREVMVSERAARQRPVGLGL